MFSVGYCHSSADVADRLLSEIYRISRQCKHLIVVTDEVFADGFGYPPETTEYMRQLGKLNRALAHKADEAVEVVYSVPVSLKSMAESYLKRLRML
jgi:adenosylcobinamide kinase/adenosylcobinamide-phosphate guanylyltransferase